MQIFLNHLYEINKQTNKQKLINIIEYLIIYKIILVR